MTADGGTHDLGVRYGFPHRLDVDRWLLDRQILDVDGVVVGTVDDLELTDPAPGAAPELTGLLCGPAAMGPRIGGRLGVWWSVIGLRMRNTADTEPARIPVAEVAGAQPSGLRLRMHRDAVGTLALAYWTREKIVRRIPGSGRPSRSRR
ncbi:MAG TPA: hypothetical protein VFP72_03555 [Kineosporiaceae bacterium]|nr:hypothetical protein [Kineosporiaceae bacterium]